MYRPAIIIQKSEQKNLQLFFREIRRVKQDNKEDNYEEFFALKCVIQRRKLSKYCFVKSNALNGTRKNICHQKNAKMSRKNAMLYVVISRVGSADNINMQLPNEADNQDYMKMRR